MIPKLNWELLSPPEDKRFFPLFPLHSSPLVARLLKLRGITSQDEAKKFLKPHLQDLTDPFKIPEMDLAVNRIFHAIDHQEKVCLYGDYDVDGVTSIALLYSLFQAYGLTPRLFIPVRSQEGYGLSEQGITRALNEGEKPDLMIAMDCGTSSIDEVDQLNDQGIDVVILDHHEAGLRGRPKAIAVVNPKLKGQEYSYLCSAGVVFKLIHALIKTRKLDKKLYEIRNYLDMVAVATVTDIVPLIGENRILVNYGLRKLAQTTHIGLNELKHISNLPDRISATHVGFRLGPRINAAGRMDTPLDALHLLLSSTQKEAQDLAQLLDEHNKNRQEEEATIRSEAIGMLQKTFNPQKDHVIVLGSRSWHPGVVGIVASQLMRLYHKPTFIISIDDQGFGKGSGRSIAGISLVKAIQHCQDTLISGGGHDMAAGLVIKEENLDLFRKAFNDYVEKCTTPQQRIPSISIDAELDFKDINMELLENCELLEPFGNSNPQPIFMSRNVQLTESPRHINGKHLKLSMRQGFIEKDAVYFGASEYTLPEPPWDIAYTIDRNTFRGRSSLNIYIQAIRASQK